MSYLRRVEDTWVTGRSQRHLKLLSSGTSLNKSTKILELNINYLKFMT
jgi:hypothetical protein